ncbi:hypothetical protein Scep_016915 [Stephania cephalantha]|uniref:Uncharacterized protein n=1 Tax=Stephania cephalantha TaxID=152367 RepID=A0AAP0NT41_9MAGN
MGIRGSRPHRPETVLTVSAKHGRDRSYIFGNSKSRPQRPEKFTVARLRMAESTLVISAET